MDPAAGMSGGRTQVKAFDWGSIAEPSGHRAEDELLIQGIRAATHISTDEIRIRALQVDRGLDSAREDAASNAGRVRLKPVENTLLERITR
jgi:hypothetical protein